MPHSAIIYSLVITGFKSASAPDSNQIDGKLLTIYLKTAGAFCTTILVKSPLHNHPYEHHCDQKQDTYWRFCLLQHLMCNLCAHTCVSQHPNVQLRNLAAIQQTLKLFLPHGSPFRRSNMGLAHAACIWSCLVQQD